MAMAAAQTTHFLSPLTDGFCFIDLLWPPGTKG